MPDAPAKESRIDRSTLIPLGAVGAVLLVLVSAWGFFDSRFTSIDKGLERQDRRLEKLEELAKERWSSTDMKLWISEFRRLNPEIEVPK